MRWLILFLVLCSCQSEHFKNSPNTAKPKKTTITGFAILEDDYLMSSLNGEQALSAPDLAFGFSHGDAILWVQSDTYEFSDWRNVRVGFELNEDQCLLEDISYKHLTSHYTEIQFSNELSDYINEHPDKRIFFHLNLDL